MNLRVRRVWAVLEEVKVRPLVGLGDVLDVELAVAAHILGRRYLPAARRVASSSSLSCTLSVRLVRLSSMMSPVFMSASGPPTPLSGHTCRAQVPARPAWMTKEWWASTGWAAASLKESVLNALG
jgi:hypothetical protein